MPKKIVILFCYFCFILLGILNAESQAANANTLAKIDPLTGGITPVANYPGFIGIPQGVSALDATNHRYLFPMAGRLFAVNTQTGVVISNPPFLDAFSSLEFESTTGTLFGIAFLPITVSVPTMTDLGMIIFTIVAGVGSVFYFRRKSATT